VTTTISPPIRILALVGILAAAVLGVVLFTQSRASSSTSESAVPVTKPAARHVTTPTHVATTQPAKTKPAKSAHRVVLLPNLPPSVAHALRHSKVVVVSLFSRGAQGDGAARQEARTGARAVHAGFVPVNVLSERSALRINDFVGNTVSTPAVLVVKRPGRIVNRFDGFVDSQLVAQAAQNAGAGRKHK
jgi:hypothetical protein